MPKPTVQQLDADDLARFWSKVKKTAAHWEWTGTINSGGYGHFRVPNGQLIAHRVAWELLLGPVPAGLTLDHIKERCGLKSCIKVLADEFGPAHLEPVTAIENVMRGDSPAARNARRTHCPQGHPYEMAHGQRRCQECYREGHRERQRRYYWERKARRQQ